jgi:hypothetical protein
MAAWGEQAAFVLAGEGFPVYFHVCRKGNGKKITVVIGIGYYNGEVPGGAFAGLNEEDRKKREKLFGKAIWDTIFTGMYGTGLPANQVKKFKTAKEEGSFWPVIGFRREK